MLYLKALSWLGPEAKAVVPELLRLLGNADDNIRISVIRALRDIGPDAKEALPALVSLLEDGKAHYNSIGSAIDEILLSFQP